ncbi:MAG: molybdopterin-dependent oxidoreductase [Nitrospirota bacterium]
MRREGITPPKFADKFARIDFEAEPMPVLCLYPIPAPVELDSLRLSICGLELKPRPIPWSELADLPRVRIQRPLICSIFNWSEVVEWEGIRLVEFIDHLALDTPAEGYYAFYSRDGHYFETLSRDEARDPRVMLAYGLNGEPLPLQHGGPLRLVVPFLQGYKSVKWVRTIRAFRRDPMGIKRLRGQSRSARLSEEWLKRYGIALPEGKPGDPP